VDSANKTVARAAVRMALSEDREEERALKQQILEETGIQTCAVNFGGEFITSVGKMIERAVVAARREGLINEEYHEEGAVAGATREAIAHITDKAIGLNVGGKIGIARSPGNIAVCVFFGIGLLHLDDVSIGMGHRAVKEGQ
jgi:hypothetical protein